MKTFLKPTASLTAIVLGSAPALAGSLQDTVVEPAPVMMAPTPLPGGDWTGFYAGGQLGFLDVEGDNAAAGVDGDDISYGLHAGYNYDFGLWVLGGELEYDWTDLDLTAGAAAVGSVDSVWRAKLKGGYDFGDTLLYATAGYADVDTSLGDADGHFYGLGVAYKVTEQFIVSGEVLRHEFDDIGGTANLDADANSFSIRGSFRF